MGTRNLTVVISGGTHRIAQYAQWDGYPSGQGKTVLEFCTQRLATAAGRMQFAEKLARCRWLTEDEIKQAWKNQGADDSGWVTMDIADLLKAARPQLSRDTGAKVLELVWNSSGEIGLDDQIDFAANSLFCEWAYVIDLDQKVLEVYSGFNRKPLALWERFAYLDKDQRPDGTLSEYYPIRRLVVFALDDLPDADTFCEIAERAEHENRKARGDE